MMEVALGFGANPATNPRAAESGSESELTTRALLHTSNHTIYGNLHMGGPNKLHIRMREDVEYS